MSYLPAPGILNEVMGPVMHGPSSSHTAASHRIGRLARDLLGQEPSTASILFDQDGSYGQVFRQQGSDLAFACGLMGWEISDDRFFAALDQAAGQGLALNFGLDNIAHPQHPNTVDISLTGAQGGPLSLRAHSTGGGSIEVVALNNWPVALDGKAHHLLVWARDSSLPAILEAAGNMQNLLGQPQSQTRDRTTLVQMNGSEEFGPGFIQDLEQIPGVEDIRQTKPVFLTPRGRPLFSNAGEMISLARERNLSLGEIALQYEEQLLGLPRRELLQEMARRWAVMKDSAGQGLAGSPDLPPMRLLSPRAGRIFQTQGKSQALGGPPARAAARALAVMEVNSAMGLVCAAPTGGACGVIPGVLLTLEQELEPEPEAILKALFAAGATGLIFLLRQGTFAAEEAGCQVEVGAAGAMAAAVVVDVLEGGADAACQAAAIALQNTLGLTCDPVQGAVEIPCHTRNAAAAASAFVCAHLILGGYDNPIPLDQSVDASLQVGRTLCPELRCTAQGGLARTPAALGMTPRQKPSPE